MGNARKHNHRRRHKSGRVSIKARFRRLPFSDGTVAAAWDSSLTAKQNYAALGLKSSLNAPADVKAHAPGVLSEALDIKVEWADLPSATEVQEKLKAAERNPRRPLDFVSEDEQGYLRVLSDKHGSNFVMMARDLKLNWKQHTKEHLQTRFERLARLREAMSAHAEDVALAPVAQLAGDTHEGAVVPLTAAVAAGTGGAAPPLAALRPKTRRSAALGGRVG